MILLKSFTTEENSRKSIFFKDFMRIARVRGKLPRITAVRSSVTLRDRQFRTPWLPSADIQYWRSMAINISAFDLEAKFPDLDLVVEGKSTGRSPDCNFFHPRSDQRLRSATVAALNSGLLETDQISRNCLRAECA